MTDSEFRPDPRRVTIRNGVVFHPRLNIAVMLLCTFGAAAVTAFLGVRLAEFVAAPPYPGQGSDIAGAAVGVGLLGLATIALLGASIYTVVWWRKRIREHRDTQ